IAYERVGTHDKPLSPEEVIQHAKNLGNIRFDSAICEGATLKDIDEGKVMLFLKKAKKQRGLDIEENSLIEEAMMRLKLLRDEKLTNTAILLFGKNPQHFFLQSEVKCIMFKGTNVTGHMIDMKLIKGDIINQLKKVEDFIFEHIPMAAWIEDWKLQRQEKWMYPPKAIRESLANALAHRDYESTSKVQVRIFDDRIEFWNPGSLPIGWTVETLKQKHESQPRNPLIAKHFFLIKYIEEVGTGTNKIIEWCANWGLPEPEFECTGTSMINTFYNFKYVDDKYLIKLGLNQRQRKVVGYVIENKRITNKELRDLFPTISGETARLNLSGLVKKGILVKHGEKKGAYYSLAYPKNIPNIPNISQESKTLSKKGGAK
ncbi:hypothetical protein FP803_02265, partial [Candidatus Woesearchaeota archaeon]|nr:hypothetical protein [Candidatus Woesearchaeota archaeon]